MCAHMGTCCVHTSEVEALTEAPPQVRQVIAFFIVRRQRLFA
jgi:hypothetical protein